MKYAEIKHLQEPELRKRLQQTRQALFDSRMKHKMQRLSNIMELRNFKRDISQLETALASLPKKPPAPPTKKAILSQKTKVPAFTDLTKKGQTEKDKVRPISESGKKKPLLKKEKKAFKSTPLKNQKPSEDKKENLKAGTTQAKVGKAKEDQKQSKPKKWFGGFFGSRSSSKGSATTAKKSFFRRKSG